MYTSEFRMAELGRSETLSAEVVGLEAGASLPFEFRPAAFASPVVVSFPHVGLEWPAGLGPRPQVNFPRNADYAVDRLYVRAEALGAATVRARHSRLVVDLNRADDDVSSEIVPDHPHPNPRPSTSSLSIGQQRRPIRNRGVLWRSAVGNIPLLTALPYAQFAERISRYHAPYYAALERLLERRRRRFGYAILLDAHSMPGTVAGDLVLGTCAGRSCAPLLRTVAERALTGRSDRLRPHFGGNWPLSFAIDDPYQGGNIVTHFGRPDLGVHAIQLEISRALYMDEYRLDLHPAPDPSFVDDARTRGRPAWLRGADKRGPQLREQRRLAALVAALDELVRALTREHNQLALPTLPGEAPAAAE